MPLVGCSEGECQTREDCDDQNACTDDSCLVVTGECIYRPVYDGQACTFHGLAGVCIDAVCGEDPCKGAVCDHGNPCTDDTCDPDTGECNHTPVPDGTTRCCLAWGMTSTCSNRDTLHPHNHMKSQPI
jgi:hypothetical protein